MLEILSYNFMQNGIIAGILVSILCGVVGSLIVVNRMVFLAGGVAHASYGGVGLALYFGIPIFLGASIFAVFCALMIAFVSINQKSKIDTFIGVMWAVGMAIGVILVDLVSSYSGDLLSYLFGSILAVSKGDIYFSLIVLLIVLLIVGFYYKDIVTLSYDSEFAMLRGINVKLFYTLILTICSLTIVVAIKLVGLILVLALLTIPVYIAQSFSKSLAQIMMISAFLATTFTIVGLFISYFYDISSGAAIVLLAATVSILLKIFSLCIKIIYKS